MVLELAGPKECGHHGFTFWADHRGSAFEDIVAASGFASHHWLLNPHRLALTAGYRICGLHRCRLTSSQNYGDSQRSDQE